MLELDTVVGPIMVTTTDIPDSVIAQIGPIMHESFQESTLDDLMHVAIDAVLSRGQRIAPTKGACLELQAVTLELENPLARVSRSVTRGRLFSALGELCWYLSGSNDTKQIAYYVPLYKEYDEDGVVFGGYGPRLLAYDGVNQIRYVIDTLTLNQDSRRAVIQLFDHSDVIQRHHDVPCTCTLQYLLRDGKLNAITYMRSNDLYLGLPHDVFAFTMLQEIIATSLRVELGSYVHVVGSLHIYDENRADIDRFVGEGWQPTTLAMPTMPTGDPWPHLHHLLRAEAGLREGLDLGQIELAANSYWGDLVKLLAVFASRGAKQQARMIGDQIQCDFFKSYVQDRIDRNMEA